MLAVSLKEFMKKYNLKKDTMDENGLQRIYNYPIYTRGSKMYSNKGFANIHNGSEGGTHWVNFTIKDNKPHYFFSFGGAPDKILFNQLPKPKIYRIYEIKDKTSKLRGSYC